MENVTVEADDEGSSFNNNFEHEENCGDEFSFLADLEKFVQFNNNSSSSSGGQAVTHGGGPLRFEITVLPPTPTSSKTSKSDTCLVDSNMKTSPSDEKMQFSSSCGASDNEVMDLTEGHSEAANNPAGLNLNAPGHQNNFHEHPGLPQRGVNNSCVSSSSATLNPRNNKKPRGVSKAIWVPKSSAAGSTTTASKKQNRRTPLTKFRKSRASWWCGDDETYAYVYKNLI